VQASHAAFEAASLRTPELDHPHFVLLGFRNQQELERALRRVQSSGFQVCPFFEADRGDELTAFATQPIFEHQRSFFRRYNCLSDDLLFSSFTQGKSKNISPAEGPSIVLDVEPQLQEAI
jgi:hypothetical protein